MTEVVREASIRWLDHPPTGVGRISVDSRAFTALPLSLPSDGVGRPNEVTPGELLAAALGSLLAAVLADELTEQGHTVNEVTVIASATMQFGEDRFHFQLTHMGLRVRARVTDMTDAGLAAVANHVLGSLRAALGLRDDVPISVDAELIAAAG